MDSNTYKLKLRQSLPIEEKIRLTNRRIKEWYEFYNGEVYVAFSGGKDSTVLLHLVRTLYPEVKAVFCDTGLEFPEIREFVKQTDNVEWLKPRKTFLQVIEDYGYPVVSKEQSQFIQQYRNAKSEKTKETRLNGNKYGRGKISKKWLSLLTAPFKVSDQCCNWLKKDPSKRYEKLTGQKPYIGIMSGESKLREQSIAKEGCNSFNAKRPISRPLSFWKEEDIWEYINLYNVPYSDIYNKGYTRTGCMFCMFGCHLEKEGERRFVRLKNTHYKLWDYCINKLNLKQVLDYIGVTYE